MGERCYFISADIEGITDVTAWCETEPGGNGYESACRQMTKEVAAACEAVQAAGYQAVVRDGHGCARNILHELLPRGVKLMRGWACDPASMMAGLNGDFAGALYIGYHSPAGTKGSPLAHTVDRHTIRWMKINGRLASEFTINSMYAAQMGVPSLYISGDAKICQMAEEEIPQIVSTAVKTCSGGSTCSLHPEDACGRIRLDAAAALEKKVPMRALPDVYEVEICLTSHQAAKGALIYPGVALADEETVVYTAYSPREVNALVDFIIG